MKYKPFKTLEKTNAEEQSTMPLPFLHTKVHARLNQWKIASRKITNYLGDESHGPVIQVSLCTKQRWMYDNNDFRLTTKTSRVRTSRCHLSRPWLLLRIPWRTLKMSWRTLIVSNVARIQPVIWPNCMLQLRTIKMNGAQMWPIWRRNLEVS